MSTPVAPEVAVGAALATALGRTVAPAANCSIFYGRPRSPVEPGLAATTTAIWVDPTSGAGAEVAKPYLNARASGSRYVAGVRCWVLSVADKYGDGLLLVRQVRDALHTKHADLGAPYCLCLASTPGEPQHQGRNEGQQHRFFVDFKLSWTYLNS